MFDIDLWREIFQSINKNRLRTLLSGFTVLFAIMLFTMLFGIANGLQNTFAEAFGDDATNSIFINSGTTTKASKGLQAGRRIQFKNDDLNYIKDENGNMYKGKFDQERHFASEAELKSHLAEIVNVAEGDLSLAIMNL